MTYSELDGRDVFCAEEAQVDGRVMTAEEKTAAWAAVMEGQRLGLEALDRAGVYTAAEALQECERLMLHPRGCPDDVREKLAAFWQELVERRPREEGSVI